MNILSTVILFLIIPSLLGCGITKSGRKGDMSGTIASKNIPVMTSSANSVSEDAKYLERVALAGMKETRAGEIAQTKANAESVRNFAAMLVKHHTVANNELLSIASTTNIYVPMKDVVDDKEIMELTNEKTGSTFDRKYMKMVVREHVKNVNLYERASADADHTEVRNFFNSQLPILRVHLDKAQTILNTLNEH